MFRGQRILIGKSNAQAGHDLCRDLVAFGGEPLGPASSIGEALDLLGHMAVHGAILDAYLQDGTVAPLAAQLTDRHIPFVLLKASDLVPNVSPRPIRSLWAWASTFQVLRELEAEMESFVLTGQDEPHGPADVWPRHRTR